MKTHLVVELVEALEGEVNNGGFHQFFNNSAGDNTAETISALELIGAQRMADILKRAAGKFPGAMPPKDRDERIQILWKEFPDPKSFYSLNEEFFEYPDDLATLLKNFNADANSRAPGI